MSHFNTVVIGSLALAQPLPVLTVLDKPRPVCPSALREPKTLFIGKTGRRLEALVYEIDRREFQDLLTGQTYHLFAQVETAGNQAFVTGFINGRAVTQADYKISVTMAMTHSFLGYLPSVQEAARGAMDSMQNMLLNGKA